MKFSKNYRFKKVKFLWAKRREYDVTTCLLMKNHQWLSLINYIIGFFYE